MSKEITEVEVCFTNDIENKKYSDFVNSIINMFKALGFPIHYVIEDKIFNVVRLFVYKGDKSDNVKEKN